MNQLVNANTSVGESIRTEVLKYVICPICTEFIGYPIYQCSSGHQFCHVCVKKINRCPTCRVHLVRTGIRNRSLEGILGCIPNIPCTQSGCQIEGTYSYLQDHNMKCSQRDVKCPLYGCTWSGKVANIIGHIEQTHMEEIFDITDDEVTLKLTNTSGQRIDINAEILIRMSPTKIFMLSFWVVKGYDTSNNIIGTATYIGTEIPEGLRVRMTLNLKSCRIVCENRPWTLAHDMSTIMQSKLNLSVDWYVALTSGLTPPIYDDNDHLEMSPKPDSLNLPIHVQIIEPVNKIGIENRTEEFKQESTILEFISLVNSDF